MAFADLDSGARERPLAEINMVPLIDVMLVLLIIFMVTAPLLTQAVRVNLPRADSHPEIHDTPDVQLTIQADGGLWWNGESLAPEALGPRLARAATTLPRPALRIRADHRVAYGRVAEVMALAARNGLDQLGFVSEPTLAEPNPNP